MKIFIGWSGDTSKRVAEILRDWLPLIIQCIDPFLSSEDIQKGIEWFKKVSGELKDSKFGIICMTQENQGSPWLHFEAGALSQGLGKPHVTPFLFDLKPQDITGPLTQFQITQNEKSDILKLLKSINNCLQEGGVGYVEEAKLGKTFGIFWPELEKNLKELKDQVGEREDKKTPQRSAEDMLGELLELTRGIFQNQISFEERRHQIERLATHFGSPTTLSNLGFGSLSNIPQSGGLGSLSKEELRGELSKAIEEFLHKK